jgi:hypothetical protein
VWPGAYQNTADTAGQAAESQLWRAAVEDRQDAVMGLLLYLLRLMFLGAGLLYALIFLIGVLFVPLAQWTPMCLFWIGAAIFHFFAAWLLRQDF